MLMNMYSSVFYQQGIFYEELKMFKVSKECISRENITSHYFYLIAQN